MAAISPPLDALFARALNTVALRRHREALSYYEREFAERPLITLPQTYNEKMFWRRVFDHNPAFVTCCDKISSKRLFAELDPALPCFETLWVGTRPEDLPDHLLRDDVVVKHNAGCNRNWFFARDGHDRAAFNAQCHAWMSEPFGLGQSEWAYSAVQPRLMAERVFEADPKQFVELKAHVFGGEVFYTVVYMGEKTPVSKTAIYSEAGERLPVTTTAVITDPARSLPPDFTLPPVYAHAMKAAKEIGRAFDYIRVDFYYLDGTLWGGEVTPYPTAGLMTNSDPAVLAAMGQAWDLRRSWFMRTPQTGWRAAYQRLLDRAL